MSGNPQVTPPHTLLVMRLVWGAFVMAPIVYLALIYLQFGDKEPTWETDSSYRLFRLILMLAAAMGLVFQQILAVILARKIKSAEPGPERVQMLMSSMILRAAFIEVIAVYGIVLTILFGRYSDTVIFCAVSIALMPLCFPRRSQLEPAPPTFPRHDGT